MVVFGSVARGEAREGSDLDDLLIVGEGLPRSRFRRLVMFEEPEAVVEHLIDDLRDKGVISDISPIILDKEEARRHRPIYLDMVIDAIIVYDKGGFFESVLREVARRLEELGARRVRLGKKWYWVLKKDYRFGEVIEI